MIRTWSMMVAVALCLQASAVEANGRFPQSINIHVQPGNDQVILLAVTFGLLVSSDGGATFRWVCEEAVGYGGIFDPDYAITAEGKLFATTFSGLRVTSDNGCTWDTVADLSTHWVQEVEVAPDGAVWTATASSDTPNQVFVSDDQGLTFQSTNVPVTDAFWKSLRVSADGQRVYVSGYKVAGTAPDGGVTGPQAFMLRSDDHGATWIELPLADVELGSQAWFFVEGVSPANPDVVYARSLGVNNSIGDALYRSIDAGQTWTRVLDTADSIVAFVIRKNGEVVAGTETDGVHISPSGDAGTFTRTETPQMRCVTENSAGVLLACGSNWEPDFFALARSQDGRAWEKVLRFSEIDSAYSCPVGTTQYDVCEAKRWPAMCEMFQCNGEVVDAGVDGGMGGNGKSGCCDASPAAARSSALLAMLLLLLWLRPRRRDRRA